MADPKLNLERLVARARRRSEKLCDTFDDRVPIILTKLGELHHVGAVRFKPILGSAGLLKTKDGFDIVVNTETRGAKERSTSILPVESSDWNDLHPSVRFSVAHEIAQLLLVEVAGGDPHKDIFFKNEQALDHLCNDLAAKFLLPRKHLEKAVGTRLFDASHLANLVQQFAVSAETLMWRMNSPDLRELFSESDGIIALVREHENARDEATRGLRSVAGKIWGARALNQFGLGPGEAAADQRDAKFPTDRSVKEFNLGDDSEGWFRKNQYGIRRVSIQWRGGRPDNLLDCEAQYQRLNGKAWILTIRVLGGPAPRR